MTGLRRVAPAAALIAWLLGPAGALRLGAAPADEGEAGPPHAVVLMYSRFGEDADPTVNISADLFDEHLDELAHGHHVLPLSQIVAAIASGSPLPPRAVAITIDQAYASAYRVAWPKLRRRGFPFTVFVATDAIDRGGPDVMSWDQLGDLADAGVEIGNLTASRPHLPDEDRAYALGQIATASDRIEAELGTRPTLFAYPYGEYDPTIRSLVKLSGFRAAFGQQSGVANPADDVFALPRFTLNDAYGAIERFRLAVSALPLPVVDFSPADPMITDNPPQIGFTVDPGVGDLAQLACFVSGVGAIRLRAAGRRVELALADPLPDGRSRLNCTLPAGDGRWRWLGRQFSTSTDE